MRFLLYNIRYGTGSEWHFHFPFPFSGYLRSTHKKFLHLIDFVESVNPDIIGLLEVDSGSFRFRRECQANTLAKQLQHYCVYQSKYARESIWRKLPLTNKQGNAILTNRTIHNKKIHYFRKGIKRMMIELEIEQAIIFLVHLSIKYQHRHHQLDELRKQLKRISKPVILAGDFNVLRGDHELEDFLGETKLINANRGGLPSFPSRRPSKEIDFILHSPHMKVSHFSMPEVAFSDHRPLVCDFEI